MSAEGKTLSQVARDLKMRALVAPDLVHTAEFSSEQAIHLANCILKIEAAVISLEVMKFTARVKEERRDRVQRLWDLAVLLPIGVLSIYLSSTELLTLIWGVLQ